MPAKRQFTEPIGLSLTKNQLKGLEMITKKQRARSKQQVLRRLLDNEIEKEGIRFHKRGSRTGGF